MWNEEITKTYLKGLQDGQEGKASREAEFDFRACYLQGYLHGQNKLRREGKEKRFRVIESNSLPYFRDDGLVNIFDRKTGKRVFAKKENFKDVTTEGGRMIGSFKFEVTGVTEEEKP